MVYLILRVGLSEVLLACIYIRYIFASDDEFEEQTTLYYSQARIVSSQVNGWIQTIPDYTRC
jgi:hypothetical protein